MLDSVGPHTAGNIWQKLDNAPGGEADPMTYEEDQKLSNIAKTSLTFLDLIDAVNPLQHIPLVSTIYRNIAGDRISDVPKFIGGALYGGPIGLVAALGSYIIEAESTKTQQLKQRSALAAKDEQIKQHQISNAKDGTFEVFGKHKTNHSAYPLVNSVAQKAFPLPSKTETLVVAENVFKSGKVYAISPQNAHKVQEIRGSALDRLIENASKTYRPENSNHNNANTKNQVVTDRKNIENWMLEKLGKYNKLQNSK